MLYDAPWNFWGGPFYGPGTQIGGLKLHSGRCPRGSNVISNNTFLYHFAMSSPCHLLKGIFIKNYTTGYLNQDVTEQISVKCGYHLF